MAIGMEPHSRNSHNHIPVHSPIDPPGATADVASRVGVPRVLHGARGVHLSDQLRPLLIVDQLWARVL